VLDVVTDARGRALVLTSTPSLLRFDGQDPPEILWTGAPPPDRQRPR
jgi:hypothetical protein